MTGVSANQSHTAPNKNLQEARKRIEHRSRITKK